MNSNHKRSPILIITLFVLVIITYTGCEKILEGKPEVVPKLIRIDFESGNQVMRSSHFEYENDLLVRRTDALFDHIYEYENGQLKKHSVLKRRDVFVVYDFERKADTTLLYQTLYDTLGSTGGTYEPVIIARVSIGNDLIRQSYLNLRHGNIIRKVQDGNVYFENSEFFYQQGELFGTEREFSNVLNPIYLFMGSMGSMGSKDHMEYTDNRFYRRLSKNMMSYQRHGAFDRYGESFFNISHNEYNLPTRIEITSNEYQNGQLLHTEMYVETYYYEQ